MRKFFNSFSFLSVIVTMWMNFANAQVSISVSPNTTPSTQVPKGVWVEVGRYQLSSTVDTLLTDIEVRRFGGLGANTDIERICFVNTRHQKISAMQAPGSDGAVFLLLDNFMLEANTPQEILLMVKFSDSSSTVTQHAFEVFGMNGFTWSLLCVGCSLTTNVMTTTNYIPGLMSVNALNSLTPLPVQTGVFEEFGRFVVSVDSITTIRGFNVFINNFLVVFDSIGVYTTTGELISHNYGQTGPALSFMFDSTLVLNNSLDTFVVKGILNSSNHLYLLLAINPIEIYVRQFGPWMPKFALNSTLYFSQLQVNNMTTEADLQKESQNNLVIYPNPACDFISFEGTDDRMSYFEVIDISGKKFYSGKISEEQTVYIENLSAGLYLLKCSTEQGKIFTRKFVKN